MESLKKDIRIIQPISKSEKVNKIRVGAYCRVSTNSDDQLNSFFAQMKYYSDYIRLNDNMTLVDIYADEGITGTSMQKRDDFKRMLKDALNKKLDRILVKSVTRFARNSLECIETIRKLNNSGVSVFFENDNIDTASMNSEMILYIKSAFAQGEALSASRRMKTAIRMKMENGTYTASHYPFGYRLVDNKLVVFEEEAKIIKDIFKWYLSGIGTTIISKRLCDMDTGLKNFWTNTTVQYILRNEKYTGNTMHQKTYTPEQFPLMNIPNRGECAKYYVEDTHPALITIEDFESVQKLMNERVNKYHKSKSTKHSIYDKKIVCGSCKRTFKRKNNNDWICSRRGNETAQCDSRIYTDKVLNRSFVTMYNRLKQHSKIIIDDTILQLQLLKSRINNGNDQITIIDNEIAKLGKDNTTYCNLFERNIIDEYTFMQKRDVVKSKITELRSRRMKLVNEDEEEQSIEKLRQLKKIINDSPEFLHEVDDCIFNKIVEKIIAESDGSLTYIVLGGIGLNVEVLK